MGCLLDAGSDGVVHVLAKKQEIMKKTKNKFLIHREET